MQDFQVISNLLKSLGLESALGPFLVVLLFFYLIKRYLLSGLSVFAKSAFDTYMEEQKERIAIQVKLEKRLEELAEQLRQLVATQWDTRRFVDTVLDAVKNDHQEILSRLDLIMRLMPKRKEEAPA